MRSVVDFDVESIDKGLDENEIIISQLKTQLRQLPLQIYKAKKNLAHIQDTVVEINKSLSGYGFKIQYEVVSAVDEKGKPLYSNVMMRASEVQKRLGGSVEYQQLSEKLVKAKLDEFKARIDLEYLVDLFKSVRLLAKMAIGREEM